MFYSRVLMFKFCFFPFAKTEIVCVSRCRCQWSMVVLPYTIRHLQSIYLASPCGVSQPRLIDHRWFVKTPASGTDTQHKRTHPFTPTHTHARTHTNRHTAAELQRKQQRPQLCLTALALGVGDQPLKGDVDIVLLFARDTVAADFPVLYAGEVHPFDQARFI